MTTHERVQAVADYGFTERQARFLVLVMRHEPQEFDAKSVFEGRVYTEHSQLLSKAINAKMHGARAVLFVIF